MLDSPTLEPFRSAVAAKLTTLRQRKGMSQTALAAELGTTQSLVSRVEANQREIGLDEAFYWGESLGLSSEQTARMLAETWDTHAARRQGYWR